jgi:hypothetical protein
VDVTGRDGQALARAAAVAAQRGHRPDLLGLDLRPFTLSGQQPLLQSDQLVLVRRHLPQTCIDRTQIRHRLVLGNDGLQEVGAYREPGNDFLGVMTHKIGDKNYLLVSDRNYGLYIFDI